MIYFDPYYLILVVPAMIVATWAQLKVSSTFNKYSKVPTTNQLTGAQAARNILDANGLYDVRLEHTPGQLTDHYDPRTNVIRLSDNVYNASTVAAVGVAAHETGHALQYAAGYFPIKVRSAIIPITQVGSYAAVPLVFLGIIMSLQWLITAGIVLFALIVVFQLVTLPVELNASSRAVAALGGGGHINTEEEEGVKKVLNAAALTYLAALLVAVLNLVRLVLLASSRSRKN